MRRRSTGRLLIAACCALVLLAAQVLGLHFHRHFDPHQDHAPHQTVLSTWDAQLHVPDIQANPAVHAGADLDIEVASLAAPKLKFKPPAYLLALIPCTDQASTRLQAGTAPVQWVIPLPHPTRYRLRPPSQAPPSPV